MMNLMWGGLESNQVGTAEFVDFCRQVHAEPLMCVNFEGDGREQYKYAQGAACAGATPKKRPIGWRTATTPTTSERRSHGIAEPLHIRYWQLGNETSYDDRGFDQATAIARPIEFAKAMRAVDPVDQDHRAGATPAGRPTWQTRPASTSTCWRSTTCSIPMTATSRCCGASVPPRPGRDLGRTDGRLEDNDAKIREARDSLDGRKMPLAMTECHFAIPGRNRCDVLSTWAAGVSYGRILNNHQRHGDVLKIATAADFCGTRWQSERGDDSRRRTASVPSCRWRG